MIKILIVALAYLMMYKIDSFDADHYYFLCSITYSLIAIISSLVYRSKLVMIYATVSFLSSISYLMLNYNFYLFEYLIWDAVINMSLLLDLVELLMIVSGGISAGIFISNKLGVDMRSIQSSDNRMVTSK